MCINQSTTVILLLLAIAYGYAQPVNAAAPIDRRALVTRHNVVLSAFNGERPLSVGNGEFAFNMDITGLQSFVPFNTMAQWGWHSGALPQGTQVADYTETLLDTHGRLVPYALPDPAQPRLSEWLASSPHRINLGRIGLELHKRDGALAQAQDIAGPRQELDLWSGIVTSRFDLEGVPVQVQTACHPLLDVLAVRIESALIAEGRLRVFLAVPGNNPLAFANFVGDWDNPAALDLSMTRPCRADLRRVLDDHVTHIALAWDGAAALEASPRRERFVLAPAADSSAFSFVCAFSPELLPEQLPDANAAFSASAEHWERYWRSGGAIDLSESTDPRWHELERRIVLSQYLLAVHCAGSLPPQESGLVNNGWYGRFHMEMYWWHGAHWALWQRWPQLRRSLDIYNRLLPGSIERAAQQGYSGARWPKCIGPEGREWPNEIHALLAWQQPHPLFFAELDYRANPTRETLEHWLPVVEATADFMAAYAHYDSTAQHFVLGPPLHVVSENTDPYSTRNPAFELGYWRFGLRTAQLWRERLGLPRIMEWDSVLAGLAALPQQDGRYVLHEGVQDMWTRWNFEHPALAGTLGMLPGDGVDPAMLRATLVQIGATWNFERTWGWDFPLLAMTAARLGEPAQAIDYLLHPSSGFQFDERGLATGGPFPYFPSNGGLLYAAALMAGGWDGAPAGQHAPGFPADGTWTVRCEGLAPAP